jgi:hypothetical protein
MQEHKEKKSRFHHSPQTQISYVQSGTYLLFYVSIYFYTTHYIYNHL